MTGAELLYNVHYMLGQDPTSTTNFVTGAEVLQWLREANIFIAKYGRVQECLCALSVITCAQSHAHSSFYSDSIHTDTVQGIVEIVDVSIRTSANTQGRSMKKIDFQNKDQYFYDSSDLITTTMIWPVYYSSFGSYLYLHPALYSAGGFGTPATLYIDLYYYGIPSTIADVTTSTPKLETECHYLLAVYAAGKGKMKYGHYSEAGALFDQLGAALNIEPNVVRLNAGAPPK